MGEKCNLMIPWTKVQKKFHCSYGSNHTQAIVLQLVSIDQKRLDKGRRPLTKLIHFATNALCC